MARMPMGPYTPVKTAQNLAKKYEGKTAAQHEKMITADRPFFREALKAGGSVVVPNPVDASYDSPRGKALKRMKGKKK